MQTVKQIQRLWEARKYDELIRELIANRQENSFRVQVELSSCVPAAAMALIRLDELNQGFVPLNAKLVRALIAAQEADGGWIDPMVTSLCLRALMASKGAGLAIERGLFYIAAMQKSEGIWPKVPLRRMPNDPFVSAFVLYQLGEDDRFRAAVRFLDALNWFEANERTLDAETRRLWNHASLRCRLRNVSRQGMLVWS